MRRLFLNHAEFSNSFMKHGQRLDAPSVTVAIVVIVYTVFLHLQLSKHQYDFSVFVTAGDVYVDADAAPSDLNIIQDSAGYDGQFYYRLGLTPLTATRTDFGITLDIPAYRQQRILYPFLSWALSLGQPQFLPAALILVNLLALCILAWLGATYAQSVHLHAIWGLAFALFPGFLLTLSRDTVEIVEITFLFAAIMALRQHRHFLAGALLVLAVFTKETALIVPAGLLVTIPFAPPQQNFRRVWFPIIVPVVGYLFWQLWLMSTWQGTSITNVTLSANLGIPFLGLLHFLNTILPATGHLHRVWLVELLLVVLFLFAVARVFSQSSARLFIKVSWILSVALAVSLTQAVWVEDWAFLRVLSETFLFGMIILLEAPSALKRWIFGATTLSWVLLGKDVITMR
jgi:hypothetical protein